MMEFLKEFKYIVWIFGAGLVFFVGIHLFFIGAGGIAHAFSLAFGG